MTPLLRNQLSIAIGSRGARSDRPATPLDDADAVLALLRRTPVPVLLTELGHEYQLAYLASGWDGPAVVATGISKVPCGDMRPVLLVYPPGREEASDG